MIPRPWTDALKHGEVSLDQAAEIAKAEESRRAPPRSAEGGRSRDLPCAARASPQDQARGRAAPRSGASVNTQARKARSHGDELGMVHIHMELEPHVGAPIVARAEAEAQRLARRARAAGT